VRSPLARTVDALERVWEEIKYSELLAQLRWQSGYWVVSGRVGSLSAWLS